MPAGRPPLYSNAQEMQDIIDKYFESVTFEHPETGQVICRPTMSGLAESLDMCRQTLINYGGKEEFVDTIKRARRKVEVALESNLYGQSVVGTIFNLKNNFGWKDKTEREHSGSIGLAEILEELPQTTGPISERGNTD